ncbi:MAG: hypothetical protein ACFFFG_05590 [Candidatus Thorarchaeota archaeon]
MEETESIYYIILLAAALFMVPNSQDNLLSLLILGAKVFLAVAMILIAVKNIPFFTPYIPISLGDNIIKLLAWIGVLIVGILLIISSLLSIVPN